MWCRLPQSVVIDPLLHDRVCDTLPAFKHLSVFPDGTQAILVLVIVLPILLCFFWSTFYISKRLKKTGKGRNRFGVKPPLEGPDSTLVVT